MAKKKQEQPDKFTILVGTNSLTEAQYPAYSNHCQFWFRLGRSYPHINFVFWNPARMSIDRMRNAAAQAALDIDAKYILFLDDDVIVDPNKGLQGLLDADADLAAAKVVIRGYPFNWMCFKKLKDGTMPAMPVLPNEGYVDVDAVGFSFALLKTDVLRHMKSPWFVTGVNCTEDIYFCMNVRDLFPEYSIKVDCNHECGHILWPEIMAGYNRRAYREYFLKINPHIVEMEKAAKLEKKKEAFNRGEQYLERTKKQIEA